MAQSLFDEVLAQVNQLPPSEQQKLYKVLSAKLSRSDSRARDKHAKDKHCAAMTQSSRYGYHHCSAAGAPFLRSQL
ncbi:MAG: hypothetical protein ACR2LZ_00550 [Pyrinomonadaceae bacterium]